MYESCLGMIWTRYFNFNLIPVLDSIGRPAAGIMDVTMSDYGDFDQCLAVTSYEAGGTVDFRGQHCTIAVRPPALPPLSKHSVHKLKEVLNGTSVSCLFTHSLQDQRNILWRSLQLLFRCTRKFSWDTTEFIRHLSCGWGCVPRRSAVRQTSSGCCNLLPTVFVLKSMFWAVNRSTLLLSLTISNFVLCKLRYCLLLFELHQICKVNIRMIISLQMLHDTVSVPCSSGNIHPEPSAFCSRRMSNK